MRETNLNGIMLLDNQHNIIWWNDAACLLLNIQLDRFKEQSVLNVIDHNDFILLHNNGQSQIRTLTNKDRLISLRLAPFVNKQQIIILQDITRDQHLDKMRRDFIANASHELRTPLTVFRGYLEILQNQPTVSELQLTKIIKDMFGQAERMERLVEDLLLLSHLESENPDLDLFQQVPVAALLRSICFDAEAISAGKHQIIQELDDSLTLYGNADELSSAFSNLIYNAVQYTPQGGTITIKWFNNQHGKEMQVIDNGIGIDQKYFSRITQRFYRIDKSRRYKGIGGTGLGLAIVKHVLYRHQGDLTIKSQLDKGSTFTCHFPIVPAKMK